MIVAPRNDTFTFTWPPPPPSPPPSPPSPPSPPWVPPILEPRSRLNNNPFARASDPAPWLSTTSPPPTSSARVIASETLDSEESLWLVDGVVLRGWGGVAQLVILIFGLLVLRSVMAKADGRKKSGKKRRLGGNRKKWERIPARADQEPEAAVETAVRSSHLDEGQSACAAATADAEPEGEASVGSVEPTQAEPAMSGLLGAVAGLDVVVANIGRDRCSFDEP